MCCGLSLQKFIHCHRILESHKKEALKHENVTLGFTLFCDGLSFSPMGKVRNFKEAKKCNLMGGKSRHEMKIWVSRLFLLENLLQDSIDCKPFHLLLSFSFVCTKPFSFVMQLWILLSLTLKVSACLSGKKGRKSGLDLQTSLP